MSDETKIEDINPDDVTLESVSAIDTSGVTAESLKPIIDELKNYGVIARYFVFKPPIINGTKVLVKGHREYDLQMTAVRKKSVELYDRASKYEYIVLRTRKLSEDKLEKEHEKILRFFNKYVTRIIEFVYKNENKKLRSIARIEKMKEAIALLEIFGIDYNAHKLARQQRDAIEDTDK